MLVVNDTAAWEQSGAAEGNWNSADENQQENIRVCAERQETPGVCRPLPQVEL